MMGIAAVNNSLQRMSQAVNSPEDIVKVATIYANGDKDVGSLIYKAIDMVGQDGVVSVKLGKSSSNELELVEGLKIDRGFLSPYFINTPCSAKIEFQNALILLCNEKITDIKILTPAIELSFAKRRPLVILVDEIGSEVLSNLVINRLKYGSSIVAVRGPGFGAYKSSMLKDIGIATGGTVFGDKVSIESLNNVRYGDFGKVGEVIITKEDALLLRGKGKRGEIARRVNKIKDDISGAMTSLEEKVHKKRLARLITGVAIMHIGGINEAEMQEKRNRILEALNATRAAVEEGIVVGGGIALLRCIPSLDKVRGYNHDQKLGVEILRNALKMPFLSIAKNAGIDGSIVLSAIECKVGHGSCYYDTINTEFGDLIESGVFDPTKFVKTAVTDAANVTSLLKTTQTVGADI